MEGRESPVGASLRRTTGPMRCRRSGVPSKWRFERRGIARVQLSHAHFQAWDIMFHGFAYPVRRPTPRWRTLGNLCRSFGDLRRSSGSLCRRSATTCRLSATPFSRLATPFSWSATMFRAFATTFRRLATTFCPSATLFRELATVFWRFATPFSLSATTFRRSATRFSVSATRFSSEIGRCQGSEYRFRTLLPETEGLRRPPILYPTSFMGRCVSGKSGEEGFVRAPNARRFLAPGHRANR